MTAVPQPTEPTPTAAPAPPRPINGLGTAAAALLAATGLLYVMTLFQDWSNYGLISDHVSGRISEDEFWQQYSASASLTLMMLMLPIILAAGITWLVWVHRARTNAGVLSPAYRFRYSPGFSVGGMVVPFANYWWSRPILEDICIGSSPDRPADDTVRLVRVWWGIAIGGTVLALFGRSLFPVQVITYSPDGTIVGGGADAVQGFLGTALYNTMLALVFAPTVALLAVVIRRVSRQQTEILFPAGQA
ncbi:DUF4328 domain-containing protein [Pseudonocardia sp. DLS-67]